MIAASGAKGEVLDLMLELAQFEEEQNQVHKARKIYENIQNDIAPECLKAAFA
jgi:hypothetical protein